MTFLVRGKGLAWSSGLQFPLSRPAEQPVLGHFPFQMWESVCDVV